VLDFRIDTSTRPHSGTVIWLAFFPENEKKKEKRERKKERKKEERNVDDGPMLSTGFPHPLSFPFLSLFSPKSAIRFRGENAPVLIRAFGKRGGSAWLPPRRAVKYDLPRRASLKARLERLRDESRNSKLRRDWRRAFKFPAKRTAAPPRPAPHFCAGNIFSRRRKGAPCAYECFGCRRRRRWRIHESSSERKFRRAFPVTWLNRQKRPRYR